MLLCVSMCYNMLSRLPPIFYNSCGDTSLRWSLWSPSSQCSRVLSLLLTDKQYTVTLCKNVVLVLLVSLSCLRKQAAMLTKPMWQETEYYLWLMDIKLVFSPRAARNWKLPRTMWVGRWTLPQSQLQKRTQSLLTP